MNWRENETLFAVHYSSWHLHGTLGNLILHSLPYFPGCPSYFHLYGWRPGFSTTRGISRGDSNRTYTRPSREARPSVSGLPETDIQHIAVDIERLYRHLTAEWVSYTEHLKLNYPFLFSLVVRIHPFQEHPSPVVV